MLEHSAMLYGAVSPPTLSDDDVLFPDFYTRLGPCELQDPLWVKMSAVAAGATKKRKKSDTKPQAQINKCNNEKRRREQENIYIEELAELISANFGDMSSLSVKPDKCAILQETVNQIRSIKTRDEGTTATTATTTTTTTTGTQPDAVQQGEVSSSRPAILANELIAPLLLEALDGFLFVVSAEGKVEFVTDNVATYIKFTREDVLGKSVYNFIHHGDHARFSTTLLPSISWGSSGSTSSGSSSMHDGNGQTSTVAVNNNNNNNNNNNTTTTTTTTNNNNNNSSASRSRSFYCRLLVKSADEQDETMEEKQTRVNQYEQMHISSTQLPYNNHAGSSTLNDVEETGGDPGPCLMCLARRIPQCEKVPTSSIEQFTTKLDISGKIIGIDVSGVSATYAPYINKDLVGRVVQDLCIQQDLLKLATHLKDTMNTGHAKSEQYRMRISSPDKYIRVQTKSKLFKNNPPDEDFIMATHSIIGDHEPNALELDGGSVGGPMMPSVMNGARNGVPSGRFSDGGSSSNSLPPTSNATYQFSLNADLEFDFFPSSTWGEMGSTGWGDTTPRPDSCASVTPVSTPTPRPPSAPVYSPAPPALPSPYGAQPSPSATVPTSGPNNNNNNLNPFNASFPFSPLTDAPFSVDDNKDSKENVLEEASAMAESGRLRNLLTKPPTSSSNSDNSNDAEVRNKHRILKGLLNQEDDEENRNENRASPRGLVGGRSNSNSNINNSSGPGPSPGQSSTTDQPKHANNMLLRLLNEKSDDDDLEQRAGLKKQSELLQQLLKEQNEERKAPEAQQQSQDDALLRSLGFSSSPSPPSSDLGPGKARKRPSDERDDLLSKRPNDSVQVSSSGPTVVNSKLYEKNKMLASLLAKQPSCTPIPPIPASVISATPQDKLPRVTKNDFGGGMLGQPAPTTSQSVTEGVRTASSGRNSRLSNRPPPPSYLNQMLAPTSDNHTPSMRPQSTRGSFNQMDANSYAATPVSTAVDVAWDLQSSSDPLLSDILDSVIDIVPDAVMSDNSAIMNLLDAIESPQVNNNYHQAMNEKMAINAIQKSLMQCETAVKSPSSPTISLPATPPSYSAAMTSSQTTQQQTTAGSFPPPPVYQRPPSAGFPLQQQRPGQVVRPGAGGQYTLPQQQQLIMQQRKLLQQQQEQHKRRLLQQQQQQQLLIPSNAAAAELNPGLQNIDSLINNTVAPNVTLQRSSSVPDSQLSPGYSNSIMTVNNGNQTQRHGQPYSPHSQLTSPLNQQQSGAYQQTTVNNFQQGGARLSPHPPFQQQLSPRQAYPPGQQPTQPTTWAQTQVANRLSLQQQQNPMLNAQLTGNYASSNRGFQVQRQQQPQQQRAIGSPGAAATRQSPFPPEAFPPPTSPTSGFSQNQFQQQMRLQRTISAPTATTQLPGGLGSPRPYIGRGDHPPGPGPGSLHHSPYPTHPQHPQHPTHPQQHHHQHQHPMMYQQDSSQYCYDQAGLQLAFNGADRGRGPPPHLQGGGAGSGNGMNATSEYVRQELRAVVGARTGQAQPPPPNVRAPSQQVSPTDLEALGLSFEMSAPGASDSPKLWGAMGSDMGSMSPQPPPTLSSSSRTTTEEMGRQGDQKSSLLQKLLSE